MNLIKGELPNSTELEVKNITLKGAHAPLSRIYERIMHEERIIYSQRFPSTVNKTEDKHV